MEVWEDVKCFLLLANYHRCILQFDFFSVPSRKETSTFFQYLVMNTTAAPIKERRIAPRLFRFQNQNVNNSSEFCFLVVCLFVFLLSYKSPAVENLCSLICFHSL